DEINVEIFPNRPDMLSVQGFARAFSSFIGVKPGLRKYDVRDSGHKVIIDKSVSRIRPYTACAIVKGIHYDDSKIKEVIQIQEKLHVTYGRNRRKVAIGIYPFEKITPPINFVAKKPEDIVFQPLEFPRELNGRQILSQHPAGREYGHLLDGFELYPLFVDSKGQVLSMPPIINSHTTGKISDKTRDVFIECSGFDFDVLKRCINIIVTALADMGGQIFSIELNYPDMPVFTPDLKPSVMPVDLKYVNKILGTSLSEDDLKRCLEAMGYGYKNKKVYVPAYRADILHQIDFVEDVAIAYGYENFKSVIPNVATVGQESSIEVFKNKIADCLVGLGLLEVNTYNLTRKDFQCERMCLKIPLVELANSVSAEYGVLRAWLIPSLVEVLSLNLHNEYPQNIFGFGTVFRKMENDDTGIGESERLAVLLCHDRADYTSIRQVLDCLLRSIDIAHSVEDTEHDSFIPGRVGQIVIGKKRVGFVGELHPKVLEAWSLDVPVVAMELDIKELVNS
ncbi:MAG: phenylalanine--tRNA ligase subunit beta, partial [Candidatus Woesearchaeota archaeon]